MKFEKLLRKAWPYLGKYNTFSIDEKNNELYIRDYLGNRFFDIDPFNLIGVSEDIKDWLCEQNIKVHTKQLYNNQWVCQLTKNGISIAGSKSNSKEFAILIAGEKYVKVSR